MNERDIDIHEQKKVDKKSYRRLYILISILLLIIASIYIVRNSVYSFVDMEIIRQAAADELNKKPRDLTSQDYKKITKLQFTEDPLSDLRPLKMFPNLRELMLYKIGSDDPSIPDWLEFLDEIGLIKPMEKRKLTNF